MSCDDTIYMKKGDRLPDLLYWLEGPEPLTALPSAVSFKFEPSAGGAVTSGTADIIELTGGRVKVRYQWGASDTATIGTFRAEFVATFSGKEMTFPNGDGANGGPQYLVLVISDDVS